MTKKAIPEEVIAGVADKNPLKLRVAPTFGFMGAIDSNPYLINKYTAGFSAEIPLSANVSIEGTFRYATFNITKDIFLSFFSHSFFSGFHSYFIFYMYII